MNYRGYSTKSVSQTIPQIGTRTETAIFCGDTLMSYVQDDKKLIRRVIDTKIKEGQWPDNTNSERNKTA